MIVRLDVKYQSWLRSKSIIAVNTESRLRIERTSITTI